jgi:hypothetical protein
MPHTMGLDVVALAFSAFNVLRIVFYIPQIVAVARDQYGAQAISFSCWTVWACANVSTGIYAWDRLGDDTLVLVTGLNAACCVAVLGLTAYKRATHARPMKGVTVTTAGTRQ